MAAIEDFESGLSRILPNIAQKIAYFIQEKIMNGELETLARWPAYKTKNWMQKKARKNYYQQMLMMTGNFVASILPIILTSTKATIGVDDPIVRRYMITHELGIAPQPERSVFATSLRLYGDEWVKLIKEEIEKEYLEELQFKIKKLSSASGFPSG